MLLEDRNAVIYGGGGAIGGVAWIFAWEGARVFLTARAAGEGGQGLLIRFVMRSW